MHSITQVTTPAMSYDLTTVDDANAYLGLTPSTSSDIIVADQITAASKMIAAECGRIFGQETVTETFIMRLGEGIRSLVLERTPITSIVSVSDNGQTLMPAD